MMQQPSLYTHSVEDMVASWITRPTNLITVVVVCQTNGTYDGGVLYIVVVIDGKDQIAFLSLKIALVIFSWVILVICCLRLSNDALLCLWLFTPREAHVLLRMQKRPKSSSAEIASLPLWPVEFEDSPFSPRRQDLVEKPSIVQQLRYFEPPKLWLW
jgi:hypothetical protein